MMETTSRTPHEAHIPFLQFVVLGALQGLALYVLLEELREFNDTLWSRALVMFALAAPLAYLLTATWNTMLRAGLYALCLALLIPGLYWLSELTYGDPADWQQAYSVSLICGLFISYISIPFFRTRFERGQSVSHYPSLFEFAWNLPVIMIVASLFTGVFWLVLFLWAALFELINIDFFSELFRKPLFGFVATQTAFATAVAVVRIQERIILALRGIVFALMQVLAPVLAAAMALWVCTLPFTGLQPLWETWSAASLMLIVSIIAVTLINAVIGEADETERSGLKRVLLWTARLQSVLLPVFICISFYAIFLRVDQYGLTVLRIYALIVTAIGAGHALTYAVLALLPVWSRFVRGANIILASAIVLIAILIQTPLINPYSITAQNQLDRLRSGAVAADEFDYGYLRYRLGAAGERAIETLRTDTSFPDRDVILQELDRLDGTQEYYQWRNGRRRGGGTLDPIPTILDRNVKIRPEGHTIDPLFRREIIQERIDVRQCAQESEDGLATVCYLFADDVLGDSRPEYIFVRSQSHHYLNVMIYYRRSGAWAVFSNGAINLRDEPGERDRILEALDREGITLVTPPFRIPQIGGYLTPVSPVHYWWGDVNNPDAAPEQDGADNE